MHNVFVSKPNALSPGQAEFWQKLQRIMALVAAFSPASQRVDRGNPHEGLQGPESVMS
jgi:hypothetical protein